jgi:hypothetical protein
MSLVVNSEDKFVYGVHHWMDVAIVFVPLVEFLAILGLLRLAGVFELQEVSRLGRLYRLPGRNRRAAGRDCKTRCLVGERENRPIVSQWQVLSWDLAGHFFGMHYFKHTVDCRCVSNEKAKCSRWLAV